MSDAEIVRVDGDEVRIAVYDQYWSTLGGGEQFAGGIAVALADHHDVTLVGPEPIDTARFAERLGIDLAGLPLRRIDQESDVSVLSADYDVLVNCTYQSTAVNRAAHGIYVVHFPGEVAGERQRRKDEVRRPARPPRSRPRSCCAAASTSPTGAVAAGAPTAPASSTSTRRPARRSSLTRAGRAARPHVELWDGRRPAGGRRPRRR